MNKCGRCGRMEPAHSMREYEGEWYCHPTYDHARHPTCWEHMAWYDAMYDGPPVPLEADASWLDNACAPSPPEALWYWLCAWWRRRREARTV